MLHITRIFNVIYIYRLEYNYTNTHFFENYKIGR